MTPCSFNESNTHYDKPEGWTYEQCEALSVYVGTDIEGSPVIISCWKPTAEELKEINRTGRIWCFHYGVALQPHALSGTHPFKEE